MQRTLRTASSSAPEDTADRNDRVETGRAHPRMSAPNFNWVLQSVAQLQRIAIARALLKRSKVLIFDVATRNLVATTAQRFAQTVHQLKGKVTIIFIAYQVPKG